jgi:hypothetical protein
MDGCKLRTPIGLIRIKNEIQRFKEKHFFFQSRATCLPKWGHVNPCITTMLLIATQDKLLQSNLFLSPVLISGSMKISLETFLSCFAAYILGFFFFFFFFFFVLFFFIKKMGFLKKYYFMVDHVSFDEGKKKKKKMINYISHCIFNSILQIRLKWTHDFFFRLGMTLGFYTARYFQK